MKRYTRIFVPAALLIVAALILSGCHPKGPDPAACGDLGVQKIEADGAIVCNTLHQEAAAEPTEEPAAEPTDEPAAEPTDEPAAEPTEEPAAEPTDEPTDNALSPAAICGEAGVQSVSADGSFECYPPTDNSAPAAALTFDGIPDLTGMSTECPTDGQMQHLFGFDTRSPALKPVNTGVDVPWDGCKWTLQSVSEHVFEDIPFLKGWQLSVTDASGVPTVYYGDGEERNIMGATLRYLPWYLEHEVDWVLNPNHLLSAEMRYGLSMDPAYLQVNGNLEVGVCPATTTEVAALIGGDAANWIAPDWSGGAWVYKGPALSITVPDHLPNWIDKLEEAFWPGDVVNGSNFSYHCHTGQE